MNIFFIYTALGENALSLTIGRITSEKLTQNLMKAYSYDIPLREKILESLTKET